MTAYNLQTIQSLTLSEDIQRVESRSNGWSKSRWSDYSKIPFFPGKKQIKI